MPAIAECPSCQARVLVEEVMLGKAAPCPKCGFEFTGVALDAITAGESFPRSDQITREIPFHSSDVQPIGSVDIRVAGSYGGWRLTKAGLFLTMLAMACAAAIWVTVTLVYAYAPRVPWVRSLRGEWLLQVHYLLVVAGIGGVALCWNTPIEQARKHVRTCVLQLVGNLALVGIAIVVIASMNHAAVVGLLAVLWITPVLLILAAMNWASFHAEIAAHFDESASSWFAMFTMSATILGLFLIVVAPMFLFDRLLQISCQLVMALIAVGLNLALCIRTLRSISTGTRQPGLGPTLLERLQ